MADNWPLGTRVLDSKRGWVTLIECDCCPAHKWWWREGDSRVCYTCYPAPSGAKRLESE